MKADYNFKIGFFLLLMSLNNTYIFAQQDTTSNTAPVSSGIDSVKANRFLLYPGFGVGLIRNEIAPVFYICIGLNHRDRYEINVNTSSIFFFEREVDKSYSIYRNTFVNLEYLFNFSFFNKKERDFNGLGVGYLVESKGQYFKESTMTIYYKRKFKYFSVMPGFVLSDDFKEIFPVISIRL